MVVRLSALRTGRLYPPGNAPVTHFCWKLSRPQGHSAIGRIMSMEKSNDIIWNRTSDFPICSTVPSPLCHHQRSPWLILYLLLYVNAWISKSEEYSSTSTSVVFKRKRRSNYRLRHFTWQDQRFSWAISILMTFTMLVHGASLAACYIGNVCHFTLEFNDPFVRKAFTDKITSLESSVWCIDYDSAVRCTKIRRC
jgi:hypothetical protein